MFDLLRAEARTSAELARRYYGADEDIPFNGRKIVVGLLAALAAKAALNREPFTLRSTARSGPIPKSFWLASRNPAAVRGPGSEISRARRKAAGSRG